MRSSTVLILSLRSLAHETIKNLVLAGIGRLIIMDDGTVTEEDLGGGFLFREEDGAVGKPVSGLLAGYHACCERCGGRVRCICRLRVYRGIAKYRAPFCAGIRVSAQLEPCLRVARILAICLSSHPSSKCYDTPE
jgi:hypothetical protein